MLVCQIPAFQMLLRSKSQDENDSVPDSPIDLQALFLFFSPSSSFSFSLIFSLLINGDFSTDTDALIMLNMTN